MTPTRIERRFRQSLYVSLGLACVCLGYAESEFLNQMGGFTAVTLLLLAVAYRIEGRWQLSIPAANAVGGVIAVAAVAWVAYQQYQPAGSSSLDGSWPTALLPYVGPLLMILIPAKLLRPKHVGDFWGMQAAGLMAVALACAMAGDAAFGLLFLAWLTATVWSLTLFYLSRQASPADDGPRLLGISLARSLAAVVVGFAVFVVTPRSSEARWRMDFPGRKIATGIAEDRPSIDLNLAGTVSVSTDVAFRVRATDAAGRPKTDLPNNQRWRTTTFNYYEFGRWNNRSWSRPYALPDFNSLRMTRPRLPNDSPAPPPLPDLGEGQYYLEFTPAPSQRLARIVAEPIWLGAAVGDGSRMRQPPIETILDSGRRLTWFASEEGDIYPLGTEAHLKPRYRQVTKPVSEPGLSPPVRVHPGLVEHLKSMHGLSALRSWCRGLVQMLVRNGKLPPRAVDDDDPDSVPPPELHEPIARAFEEYLSASGDFRYSLKLTRVDPRLDPVEDFVVHSRQGHCNRFATALALMLRSQGIPSRVVLGYYGADNHGDGTYTVRQSMAHSWVETLVRRPGPDDQPRWHWLTLDASPLAEVPEPDDDRLGRWLQDFQRNSSQFFRSFVVDYNSEKQEQARQAFNDWRAGPAVLRYFAWFLEMIAGGLGFLLVGYVARIVWRRWHPVAVAAPTHLFDQLCLALSDRLPRQAHETPRAYAAAAAALFRGHAEWRPWADLPQQLADLYYRQRYAGEPGGGDVEHHLAEALDQWRRARLDEPPAERSV